MACRKNWAILIFAVCGSPLGATRKSATCGGERTVGAKSFGCCGGSKARSPGMRTTSGALVGPEKNTHRGSLWAAVGWSWFNVHVDGMSNMLWFLGSFNNRIGFNFEIFSLENWTSVNLKIWLTAIIFCRRTGEIKICEPNSRDLCYISPSSARITSRKMVSMTIFQ